MGFVVSVMGRYLTASDDLSTWAVDARVFSSSDEATAHMTSKSVTRNLSRSERDAAVIKPTDVD